MVRRVDAEGAAGPHEELLIPWSEEDGLDLWVVDLGRGTLTRLTSSPRSEFNPVWLPGGPAVVRACAAEKVGQPAGRPAGMRSPGNVDRSS